MKAIDLVYKMCEHTILLALSDIQSIEEHSDEIDPASLPFPEKEIQEMMNAGLQNTLIIADKEHLIIIQGNESTTSERCLKELEKERAKQLDTEVNQGTWGYGSSAEYHLYKWFQNMDDAKEFTEQQNKYHTNWMGIIDNNLNTVTIQQNQACKASTDKIKDTKKKYLPGTTIRLLYMKGEPQMKPGIIGRVDKVDDIGQIHMHWETGSSLALNEEIDIFEVIKQ